MVRTVFWAWQSDHDPRVGRHLIKSAIELALENLGRETAFEERPQIDHDTKDVPGLAAIADSIFDKIKRCSVFIGDLTPIASRMRKGEKRKWVANPNVLLELGFAKHALDVDPIILVWNTACPGTKPADLPFDLAHRRAPIGYYAPSDCLKAELDVARKSLAADLQAAIAMNMKEAAAPAIAWSRASEGMRSLWLDRSRPVQIIDGEGAEDWTIDGRPKAWMRIKPVVWPKDMAAMDLPMTILLGNGTTIYQGRIAGGAFTWSGSTLEKRARTGTVWFPTDGEIWGYDSSAIHGDDSRGAVTITDVLDKWLHFLALNQKRISDMGGKAPFLVECGIGPLTNVQVTRSGGYGPASAEAYVTRTFTTASQKETIAEMWQLFRSFCDAFGQPAESFEGFEAFALGRLIG